MCIVAVCMYRPDDGEDEASSGCAKISQFFAPKTSLTEPARKRQRYFNECGLHVFPAF